MATSNLTVNDVKRAFSRKLGAFQDPSGHHIFFYFEYQGSEYTVGKISHSWRGTLNDTQIDMLARKIKLQQSEFRSWVVCTMTNQEMISKWQQRLTN